MKFDATIYQRMAKARMPIGAIQQRLCNDLQVSIDDQAVVSFVEGYLKTIHPSFVDADGKESLPKGETFDFSPLEELALNKYERISTNNSEKFVAQVKRFDILTESLRKTMAEANDVLEQGKKPKPDLDIALVRVPDFNPRNEKDMTVGSSTVVSSMTFGKDDPEGLLSFTRAASLKVESTKNMQKNYEEALSMIQEDNETIPMFTESKEENHAPSPLENGTEEDVGTPPPLSTLTFQCHSPISSSVADFAQEEPPSPTLSTFLEDRAIFTISSFSSSAQCKALISALDFSEEEEKAQIMARQGKRRYLQVVRNNFLRRFIDTSLASSIWQVVQQHAPPMDDGRTCVGVRSLMNFYRYDPNQFFCYHLDAGHTFSDSGTTSEYTFILYLNDDFVGGSTRFCSLPEWQGEKKQINAEEGKLLIFRQRDLKHCGAPTQSGRKYIIQGMLMYSPAKVNALGTPFGKAAPHFRVVEC